MDSISIIPSFNFHQTFHVAGKPFSAHLRNMEDLTFFKNQIKFTEILFDGCVPTLTFRYNNVIGFRLLL